MTTETPSALSAEARAEIRAAVDALDGEAAHGDDDSRFEQACVDVAQASRRLGARVLVRETTGASKISATIEVTHPGAGGRIAFAYLRRREGPGGRSVRAALERRGVSPSRTSTWYDYESPMSDAFAHVY